MNVLYVGVECYPFISGSILSNTLYNIPKVTSQLGVNSRVILPKYNNIDENLLKSIELKTSFYVFLANKAQKIQLYILNFENIIYYFLENEKLAEQGNTSEYESQKEKWILYQLSVVETLKYLDDFKVDIINCHDFETGLIPHLIKTKYYREFGYIKTIFTIYNAGVQGEYDRATVKLFNIDFDRTIERDGKINYTKAAIVESNFVNVISKTYARELLTSSYYSMDLRNYISNIAKLQKYTGFVHGISYDNLDPSVDTFIDNYDYSNYKEGKRLAKHKLYQKLGIDFYDDIPLIGMVATLNKQKGFDILIEGLEELINDESFKLIVVGKGDQKFEDFFKDFEMKHPFKFKFYNSLDEDVCHMLFGASDYYLMPSAIEPSGPEQFIALKYGSIPIVRDTGVLKDTVFEYDKLEKTGNGFTFSDYNSESMIGKIRYAITYYNTEDFEKIVENAMSSDYSIKNYARKYLVMFKKVLE